MSGNANLPTVVIAGYGSWPTAKINPCAQVVEALRAEVFTHFNLKAYEIPVVSDELETHLETIIDQATPDVFIGLGVAVRYTSIHAELLGINKIDLPVPDASGDLSRTKPIFRGQPIAYESTLPNVQIVEALKNAKIPAKYSFYAGTHLCNQMLYTALHMVAEKNLKTQAGFLHLPQAAENIVIDMDRIEPGPSMPLDTLIAAVKIAIECSLREVARK